MQGPQNYSVPVRTGATVVAMPVVRPPVQNVPPKNNPTKWVIGLAILLVLTVGGFGGGACYGYVIAPRAEFKVMIEQVLDDCRGDSEASCRQAMGLDKIGSDISSLRKIIRLMQEAGGGIKDIEYGGYCINRSGRSGIGKLTATIEFAHGLQDIEFVFVLYKGEWRMDGMYPNGTGAPEACSTEGTDDPWTL